MVSATAFEFAYTQAPPSMKAVAQSFELLTTCIGNIIDIFLVQIKLGDTQAGFHPNKCYGPSRHYHMAHVIWAIASNLIAQDF